MSQSAGASNSSPWHYTGALKTFQSRLGLPSPDDHHRAVLNKAYQKALAALESAQAVVAGVASGLYDVEVSQSDVSARLSGRHTTRFTGRKRKLSPSVYDYSDSCFGVAAGKAGTPTQELLPASRSELRNHQLQAVRWLASLEIQGAGGVLADELVEDRRGEVAGLLSHLLMLAPFPSISEVSALGGGGVDGRVGGTSGSHVCMLLVPSCSLSSWVEAISEHVDVHVHVYDGTADSAAALQTACSAIAQRPGPAAATPCPAARGAQPPSHAGPLSSTAQPPPPPLPIVPLSTSRRIAACGVLQQSFLSSSSSAAGVYAPFQRPAAEAAAVAASPLMRSGSGGAGASQHKPLLVVVSPLEHLQRDAGLLSQIPQRLLVVDLSPPATAGDEGAGVISRSGSAGPGSGRGGGSGRDSGAGGEALFQTFRGSFELDSGSDSGPRRGLDPRQASQGPIGRRQGMDLESYNHLHLLTRMPAACRVLLSSGIPDPAGDGIWLLLQLLAPKVHRPLWEAVCELQHGLVVSGPLGAQCKETVLSEVHGRLWGLLRPLTLHRRARDVDLTTMRATATNLNLYDHFSAARSDAA